MEGIRATVGNILFLRMSSSEEFMYPVLNRMPRGGTRYRRRLGSMLGTTDSEKDLGVLVDNELKLSKHVEAQVCKANTNANSNSNRNLLPYQEVISVS